MVPGRTGSRGTRCSGGARGTIVQVAEVALPPTGPEYRIVLANGRVVGEFEPEVLRKLLEVVDS